MLRRPGYCRAQFHRVWHRTTSAFTLSRVSRRRKSSEASRARELGYNHNFSFFVHPSPLSIFFLLLLLLTPSHVLSIFAHFSHLFTSSRRFSLSLSNFDLFPFHLRIFPTFSRLFPLSLFRRSSFSFFSLLSHLCLSSGEETGG